MLKLPLLRAGLFSGLRTHWQLMLLEKEIPAQIATQPLPKPAAIPEANPEASNDEWVAWCLGAEMLDAFVAHSRADWRSRLVAQGNSRSASKPSIARPRLPSLDLPEFAPLRALHSLA